jgi:hypothetical protein
MGVRQEFISLEVRKVKSHVDHVLCITELSTE